MNGRSPLNGFGASAAATRIAPGSSVLRNAVASDSASGYRSAGSFAVARAMTSSIPEGSSGRAAQTEGRG